MTSTTAAPWKLAADREVRSSEDDVAGLAAGAEQLERLVEDVLGLGVGAALLHVGEVRLVGLDLGRRRRVLRVQAGRQPALGAVPRLRDGRLDRERHHRAVLVRAEVGDGLPRRGLAALGLAHRTGADPAAPDRVSSTTAIECLLLLLRLLSRRPAAGPGR